jgi:hypothetical protein
MARKPFGGYTINFGKCSHDAKDIFGTSAITPSEMTKKIWAHVKKCGLSHKG